MSETFDAEVTSNVCMQGSWGHSEVVKRTMKITAWICTRRSRGGFEIYDLESQGDEYYGEGMITLDDETGFVDDYDGVGMLDLRIVEWLDSIDLVSTDLNDFFRMELTKYEMNKTE